MQLADALREKEQTNMNYSQDTSKNGISDGIKQRASRARDVIEQVRDRAEDTFRDKPYLLPVAAGALGVGVGLLLGSKLTRFIVFTAVGTLVTETFGGEIRRLSRQLVGEFQKNLGQGEGSSIHSSDDESGEPGTI
jgi:hypothetical protein